jgi:hypothetical protein
VREAPTGAAQPKEASGTLGPRPDAPPIAAPQPAEQRPATTPAQPATAQPVTAPAAASTERATTTPRAHTPPATKATHLKPKPKPQRKAAPRRRARVVPAARPPHDGTRLGLPAGALTLVAHGNDGSSNGALSAAAALLLAGAGLGGLVVGVVGRRLVRAA